ncbi:hypothetical protein [Comamonas badia]|uniref:hypothetical protein n=1 Tax=Comamonas badia TaxID=265291 RepID=UPI0004090038|nr:hypothetical protein [Comamonas badia]
MKMATSKLTSKKKPASDPKVLEVVEVPDENHSVALAKLVTDGTSTAATLQTYAGAGPELGITELVAAMRKAGAETVAGNFGRIERMLTHQFMTLDALFNNLAQRSGRQESFKGIEVLLRLALKAQSQARTTAETLALLKNPCPISGRRTLRRGRSRSTTALPRAREKHKANQTNYWSTTMANGWTVERRQRQAELIRQWQPWEQSTGPQSAEGKTRSSRNAWKGGYRQQLRQLS